MTARQLFIHRRNTNCQSLENVMNNKYIRMPDRMKLLKQAPSKKKAVLRIHKYLLFITPEHTSTLPVTKCRIIVKVRKLQPCHEEKIQRLPIFLHDNSLESNSQIVLGNQQHHREKEKKNYLNHVNQPDLGESGVLTLNM